MARITIEKYQRKNDQDFFEITLTNKHGLKVLLLNYGATLERVLLPEEGGFHDAIMHLPRREDYDLDRNFLGGTVGRIIGRMKGGRWQQGDTLHTFVLNDGPNHAHGGLEGLDTQVWAFRVSEAAHAATVRFDLVDPAGHNGYPGNVHVTATFTLDDEDRLTYHLAAVSDALTLMNPANHVYFNLGDGTVENHELTLDADYYLPLDPDSIPTAGAKSVAGTAFDFRQGQQLGTVLASPDPQIVAQNGLNHPFLLNGGHPEAVLSLPGTARRVRLETTAPSIVVYTANHFDHTGVAQNLGRYDGVALEAQFPPSADERLLPITLLAGEPFDATTSWQFDY